MLKIINNKKFFRSFVFFFVVFVICVFCVWINTCIYEDRLNSGYVVKEAEDLVGIWKVRGKSSYLILRNDGMFEFHRPLENERRCLPRRVIVINTTKCGMVVIGRWTHKIAIVDGHHGLHKCVILSLGGNGFKTVEYREHLRIIIPQLIPIILDKVSSHSQRCPVCLMNLPHDIEKTKSYEYLDKLNSVYWYEKDTGVAVSLFIGILLFIVWILYKILIYKTICKLIYLR
jgi:hypothetical protein